MSEDARGENTAAQLWTAYEAAAATGGALCARGGGEAAWAAEEWAARGVSIDTRSIRPGEIFVALRDARDGHEFIKKAFDAGAAAALVARAPDDAPDGAPLLVVQDTLQGLRDLALAARMRNFGKRIAVTGSVGKTSTKEMLRAMLAGSGAVHAADKSFNNHFGVPLTLARLPMHADYAVFEIGMNHGGEITPLSHLVRPHAAIVTAVAAAHLEAFRSVEEIAEAKAEIFAGLAPGGVAILPRDSEYFEFLKTRAGEAGAASFATFGESDDADFRLAGYRADGDGATVDVRIKGEEMTVRCGAPGRHQATNALAGLAAIDAVGGALGPAIEALAHIKPVQGRGARVKIDLPGGAAELIDESYNANPLSMAASLKLLAAAPLAPGGRRIAVLGEMLELGEEGPALHVALEKELTAAKVDRLYATGALMERLYEACPKDMRGAFASSADGLINAVIDDLKPGDIVMVKGSNGSKVSVIANALMALSEKKRT
ncbi:MAG: UDP-N-acetylmuramoyl-tripeptide--D-alanyl-D-alanine ligase [Pseudomonadota bacterium]